MAASARLAVGCVSVDLRLGDCLDVMGELEDASVDAVVTDPPYGISFMGKHWDRFDIEERVGKRDVSKLGVRLTGGIDSENRKETARTASAYANAAGAAGGYDFTAAGNRKFQAWCERWASECLRVLKPGGHLVSFGGTRTYHRLAAGVEDAGFEIRDQLAWLTGQGFPKSLNVSGSDLFCQCSPLPYTHDESVDRSDVRDVRDGVPETALLGQADADALLFDALQRDRAREGVGGSRPQGARGLDGREPGVVSGEDERLEEPGMEGRGHVSEPERELRAGALCASAGVGLADGAEGRLRDGAPPRDGSDRRSSVDSDGSGASSKSRAAGQSAREPRALAGQSLTQVGGAWALCERCGKPRVPDGLGTALKPGYEPIVLARKPLIGTVAANVMAHGTGALNIDGCRIATEDDLGGGTFGGIFGNGKPAPDAGSPLGRWPANVLLDEQAAAMLDEQSGERRSAGVYTRGPVSAEGPACIAIDREGFDSGMYADIGGASRFFYVAKVSSDERHQGLTTPSLFSPADAPERNVHPTVKPIDLMRWLCRLVTPAGGLILDPFLGSGTTGIAAVLEGYAFVGIEREPDYMQIAQARIAHWTATTIEGAA